MRIDPMSPLPRLVARILPAAVAAGLLSAPTASAADIEGTWMFGEGQVSVIAQPHGRFAGTVIAPTSFSSCPHPVRQRMWTDMTPQPDGQYFGKHEWIVGLTDCNPDGEAGPTAWRVLTRPDGSKFLRVCFTSPNRPDSQPTIAPDGTTAGTAAEPPFAYGQGACSDSTFIAAVVRPTFEKVVTLPKQGRRRCLSRRHFTIHLRNPAGDRLTRATVFVSGRRVVAATGRQLTAGVDLRGLPKGRYTVKVTVTTLLGRTIEGTRRYRTCAPSRRR